VSLPPDEDPPNTRVERLFDANEHQATIPPDAATGFAGPDEVTKTDLKTPAPKFETQVLAALERLESKVEAAGRTATGAWDELGALRGDMRTAFDAHRTAIARLDAKLDHLRSDLQLWLFGDTHRHGIAQEVGFSRVRLDSLFPMIEKLARAQQLQDPNPGTNGNGQHDDDRDRSADESGRPDR
jgi:hypothetical protein